MKVDGIARQPDMHLPVPLPNLDPAESRLGGENLLGPPLGNAIVATLDHFHRCDMTVAIQELASVSVHHGGDLPLYF